MSSLRLTALFALLALTLVLVVQNAAVVRIRFLFWSFEASLVLLLVVGVALGAGMGWLGALLAGRRKAARLHPPK